MSSSKVSFTVRRPTPVSRSSSGVDSDSSSFRVPVLPSRLSNGADSGARSGSPLARSADASPRPKSRLYSDRDLSDSSDGEDEEVQGELITGFDQFGVQRLHQKRKAHEGPLVIPALKNKDWRELARKRKTASQYVPPSGAAVTGADGSVGGLGTRDSIHSGPQAVGLQIKRKTVKVEEDMQGIEVEVKSEEVEVTKTKQDEEDEDKRALRALLAGTDGADEDGPIIDVIPAPVTETDAYQQDVRELPDQATLDDYARVPVSQFGAALLRGMGWKEGTAASRKNKGPVEPYLPAARPALLGIGAKEREVLDDGSNKRGKRGGGSGNKRPERRYVPVIKREKSGSEARDESSTPYASGTSSRRRSPSPRRGSAPSSRRSSRSPPSRRHAHREREERKGQRDYEEPSGDRGYRREKRDYNRDKDHDYEYDRERRKDGRR